MKMLALVEAIDRPSTRYRIEAYRRFWEADGHTLTVQSIPHSLWGRWRTWRNARDYDLVIVQRRLLTGFHLLWLRRHARQLIFDFDDAVYRRSSNSRNSGNSSNRRRRFTAMVHAADLVVAGNEYLAAETARFIHAERIRVIPTCVDPALYRPASHCRAQAGVELVWIGTSSMLKLLERLGPLLDAVAERLPGLSCKIICDRFPRFHRMPVLAVPWSSAVEAEALAAGDIGISWVPDDAWSRAKCHLKVLQYMAAGLPVVASPVGMCRDMVQDGVNGFLVQTAEEWLEAIARLARNPDLRRRMGQAGRARVERQFSVDCGAALWRSLLAGTAVNVSRAA
jgi:glycosyltransferase involved in cell wall biosynthesis